MGSRKQEPGRMDRSFRASRASFSTIHVHMANVLCWAGERSEPGFLRKIPLKTLFSAPISQKIRAARASPGCEPSPGKARAARMNALSLKEKEALPETAKKTTPRLEPATSCS